MSRSRELADKRRILVLESAVKKATGDVYNITQSGLPSAGVFMTGGNSFGTDAVLGTNDAYDVYIERGGTSVADFSASRFRLVSGYSLDLADMTNGSVLFAGNSTGRVTQDNSNFFWDDTNNRLGIKAAGAPARPLEVRDSAGTGAIRVTHTAATYFTDIYTNFAGSLLLAPSGNGAFVTGSTAGAQNFSLGIEQNGTGSTRVTVSQYGGTGDAYILLYAGGINWVAGIDRSDSDSFVWSATAPGTSNKMRLTTDGFLSLPISTATETPAFEIIQSSTGDSAIRFTVAGTSAYCIGIDASTAGDPFVLSSGVGLTLGLNQIVSITAGGLATWSRLDASNSITHDLINGGAGDSAIRFAASTTNSWAIGLDNDDSDKFKISWLGTGSAVLGTNDYFSITTAGVVSFGASLAVSTFLNVGTVTDAAAAGDLASGLSGAARLFYDQSVPAEYHYNSAGTIVNQISSVASTATVWNEQGADIDFRVEGDTATSLFFVDASADRISSTVSDALTTPIYDLIQSSTGDAAIRFALATAHSYATGVDNTDDAYKVSYAATGTAVLGTNDRLTIGTDGETIVTQWLQVGTVTDPATQGDFAAGLSGGSSIFFDQSAGLFTVTADDGTTGQQIVVRGLTNTNKQLIFGYQTTGNYGYIQAIIQGSGYSPLHINPGGGNVGIGTGGPDRKLDVLDTNPQLRLTYTDGSVYSDIWTDSGGSLWHQPTSGTTYVFDTAHTATTIASNVVLSVRSNGSGRDTSIQMSDNVANTSYFGMLAGDFYIAPAGALSATFTVGLNVVLGNTGLAAGATDGFLYVAGCNGTPTGTPTAYSGRVPIVVDFANNKLYFYSGGAWRDAGP